MENLYLYFDKAVAFLDILGFQNKLREFEEDAIAYYTDSPNFEKLDCAEIDFLLQKHHEIIPVEVKPGTQGKMQSMFLFLQEKKLSRGIRISMENFGHYDNIGVLPLYAVSGLFQTISRKDAKTQRK
jgi:predicted AAA+ superfamily ATPase